VQIQTTWTTRQPYFFTRITRCEVSKPVPPDAYVATTSANLAWETPICTVDLPHHNATCYLLVPRATAITPWYPAKWLGGLFRCPDTQASCTRYTAEPVAPLLAEIPQLPGRPQLAGRHIITRRPVLIATTVRARLSHVPDNWPSLLANQAN
jgi:hypothetical protein